MSEWPLIVLAGAALACGLLLVVAGVCTRDVIGTLCAVYIAAAGGWQLVKVRRDLVARRAGD
ncbi:hypothetical protein [Tsukamurella soli]